MITEEVNVPYIAGLTARLMLGHSQMSVDQLIPNNCEQGVVGGGSRLNVAQPLCNGIQFALVVYGTGAVCVCRAENRGRGGG